MTLKQRRYSKSTEKTTHLYRKFETLTLKNGYFVQFYSIDRPELSTEFWQQLLLLCLFCWKLFCPMGNLFVFLPTSCSIPLIKHQWTQQMFSYSASCLLSLKNPTSFFADKLDLCFRFEKKKKKKIYKFFHSPLSVEKIVLSKL